MRPEITIIRTFNTHQQRDFCESLMAGFDKLGIPYKFQSGAALPVHTDKIAIWGYKWAKYWMEKGKNALVGEMGYIGDRYKYVSLAWNGLNGHGVHGVHKSDNGQRFAEHGGVIHPWKHNPDAPVLLLGQLKNDQSLQGKDIEKVYNDWIRKSERPAIFRHHPVAVKRGVHLNIKGAEISQGTLYEALDNCYAITVMPVLTLSCMEFLRCAWIKGLWSPPYAGKISDTLSDQNGKRHFMPLRGSSIALRKFPKDGR